MDDLDRPWFVSPAEFRAHLEWAEREVSTWPEWKRNLLGRIRVKEQSTMPTIPEGSSAIGDLVQTECQECGESYWRSQSALHLPHNCVGHKTEQTPPVRLECQLIHPLARLPFSKRGTDAGYDVASVDDLVIRARTVELVHTGLIVACPPGYYITVEGRSSLWMRRIVPSRGILDSGFIGELVVSLQNMGESDFHVQVGDRIAQLVLHKHERADFAVVKSFSDEYSIRGTNGFGSSGRS